MKKVVNCIMACVLAIMMSFSSVYAEGYDTSKIDNAYNKIVKFYKANNTLTSPDEIIAVETLGLEAEDEFEISDLLEEMKEKNYSSATIGELTKSIIALTLIGENPNNFNNQNLVNILESYVNEDGSIVNSDGCNLDIWVLFALETISSNKVDIVADRLSTLNNNKEAIGAFWYAGPYYSEDVTGWGIEALSIANKEKYKDSIKRAYTYLQTTLQDDGSYGSWGANADTQACVLEGFMTYDIDKLLNGEYDINNINPIDVLIGLQHENGSVEVSNWQTGKIEFNAMATYDMARCLGTYKNGSFVYKAQQAYKALIVDIDENKPNEKPATEQLTKPADTEKKGVQTGDKTQTMLFMSVAMISGGLYLVLRKEYEKVH